MSQIGDGANAIKNATTQAAADLGLGGSAGNPLCQGSHPPSIRVSTSNDDSSSSDEGEGELSEARRRKEKMKAKIEKKAKKMMRKRIKEENNKHPFFGLNQVPHNYASSQYPSSQFQSVHLGIPPFFDGTDDPK
jgi:hypothetical protein